MSGRSGKLLIAAVAACLALGIGAGGQDSGASPEGPIRTFFTPRSAAADDSLPAELAGEFEKDDGSPLRSVTIDLDGDGRPEKFVLGGALSISGGRQWLIYDPGRNLSRGIVIGSIIFVTREVQEGFPILETYWKQGGEMAVVFRYACSRGRYARIHSRSLTVQEISDYFRDKPALDKELELVEIKGDAEGPTGRA